MSSPYLDRLLVAATRRRGLDDLALRAVVKATHLLGLALGQRLRECRDHGDPLLALYARWQEEALHLGLLREAVDILGRRWDKLPERQRPHYSPRERFRILRLRTLLALSGNETARMFRVSTGTVLRWQAEADCAPDRTCVGSLLKPVPPVRRFADVVRHVVQTLTLAGFPGDGSVAAHLARAGWRISRRSVQRIRRERPLTPPPLPPANLAPRAVRARYPHHVWMLDLTEIPGLFRLFSFKLAVVFDAFSRAPIAASVFLAEPDGAATASLFRSAARRFGPPRHLVTDRGAQFTSAAFRSAVEDLGVRLRYGAIGRSGSIALIERFFRTLKHTAGFRARRPLLLADLEARLEAALAYYTWLRPHSALRGRTPAEHLHGGVIDSVVPSPPPRGHAGEAVGGVVPFELQYLGDGAGVRLPYLKRVAA